MTGPADDGVSVFSVAADGTLTNVDNVTDDATLDLDGAARRDDGGRRRHHLSVRGGQFSDDGSERVLGGRRRHAHQRANVIDNATLELEGAVGVTTAVVGGTTYLFVPGAPTTG